MDANELNTSLYETYLDSLKLKAEMEILKDLPLSCLEERRTNLEKFQSNFNNLKLNFIKFQNLTMTILNDLGSNIQLILQKTNDLIEQKHLTNKIDRSEKEISIPSTCDYKDNEMKDRNLLNENSTLVSYFFFKFLFNLI